MTQKMSQGKHDYLVELKAQKPIKLKRMFLSICVFLVFFPEPIKCVSYRFTHFIKHTDLIRPFNGSEVFKCQHFTVDITDKWFGVFVFFFLFFSFFFFLK